MYDAIIVGARCAGSPTAMLLARKGYSVAVLDRATFPSDALSTHIIKRPGVEQLEKWGLLDSVLATDCPPITAFSFDIGDFRLRGNPPPKDGVPMIAPRRAVLDEILVDATVSAGAELREEFVVRELLFDGDRVVGVKGQHKGGPIETLRGHIVIGADGRNSLVARTVDAPTYDDVPPQAFYYYSYWPELPVTHLEAHARHHQFVLAIPTNDGQTCLMAGRPVEYFQEFSADVETSFHETLAIAPDLADVVSEREPIQPYEGTECRTTSAAVRPRVGPRRRRQPLHGPAERSRHHRRLL